MPDRVTTPGSRVRPAAPSAPARVPDTAKQPTVEQKPQVQIPGSVKRPDIVTVPGIAKPLPAASSGSDDKASGSGAGPRGGSDKPVVRNPGVVDKPAIKAPEKIARPGVVKLPAGSVTPDKPKVVVDPVHPQVGDKNKSEGRHPIRLIDANKLKNPPPRVPVVDRLKRGDLNGVVDSKFGRQINLKRQFELHDRGDLGRRLQLHNNLVALGGWRNRLHGPIDPLYGRNSFNSRYCGPAWYPGFCSFPMWSGWVNWCWNYNCVPICDPRPIWCRPIVYQPCVAWTWWSYPAWTSLPVVACGTWVDAPVVAIDAGFDMQLLAVRFVDPGHPEQNMGPRYRVWLRNNSPVAVAQPFNVLAYASNDRNPAAGMPEAGLRVSSMEAGQIASVDLRLPVAASTMARDADGNPAPFEFLHVIVDSHREIPEAFEANNGAVIDRRDILQIDPALFAIESDDTGSGFVNLAGEGFGPEAGQVLVNVGGLDVQAEIVGWCDLGVQVRLPAVSLAADAIAEVVVVRGDSVASNPLSVTLPAALTTAELPSP